MKPAPFRYCRPGSLAEAVEILAVEPDAKVLAGGQSLVPLLSMRLASPSVLVDINGLPGLDHVATGPDGVRVGALARHAAVLADADARRCQPLLAESLGHVAHATIRNRGTTVGSLVHADAAGELPAVLVVLGGSVEATSSRGTRTIAASDLFAGPLESTVAHDEVAVGAFFPALPSGGGVAFDEVARRHGDYALCGVAAVVRLQQDRVIEARAGYLSVSEVPTVVDLTEHLADGVDEQGLAAAGAAALERLEPLADIHATAEYRAQLVRVLTARVLVAAVDDARRRSATAGNSEERRP
ncbi:MAG: FAD binding domain-containing protein [Marmoricola sp.]